jgi:hypothetical protein
MQKARRLFQKILAGHYSPEDNAFCGFEEPTGGMVRINLKLGRG